MSKSYLHQGQNKGQCPEFLLNIKLSSLEPMWSIVGPHVWPLDPHVCHRENILRKWMNRGHRMRECMKEWGSEREGEEEEDEKGEEEEQEQRQGERQGEGKGEGGFFYDQALFSKYPINFPRFCRSIPTYPFFPPRPTDSPIHLLLYHFDFCCICTYHPLLPNISTWGQGVSLGRFPIYSGG